MAMNPIPVTFHIRAEPRPELIAAQRHRVRPYRVIVQGVAIFAVMGVGFGYLMSAMVSPQKSALPVKPPSISAATTSAATTSAASVAAAPVSAAPVVASTSPSFPVWQQPAPRPATAPFEPAEESDRTPVASIPEARPRPSHGFAPMERAPDYSGFKVTAGH
jgi:hypothetical protein